MEHNFMEMQTIPRNAANTNPSIVWYLTVVARISLVEIPPKSKNAKRDLETKVLIN